MQVSELNQVLNSNANAKLEFVLPSGESIPAHFHVTEVGKVQKTFIDCGGTIRQADSCQLQLWTASDVDHRLVAGKFGKIMSLAQSILGHDDLPVEVEYGAHGAATYTLSHCTVIFGVIRFYLASKMTDCLAKDKCGIDTAESGCCG